MVHKPANDRQRAVTHYHVFMLTAPNSNIDKNVKRLDDNFLGALRVLEFETEEVYQMVGINSFKHQINILDYILVTHTPPHAKLRSKQSDCSCMAQSSSPISLHKLKHTPTVFPKSDFQSIFQHMLKFDIV